MDLFGDIKMKKIIEDERLFGKNEWIYCGQHLRPHLTGWCTVPCTNKIGLKVDNEQEAYKKCKLLGLKIFKG